MFTDTEVGMAVGFARRSRDDAAYAQALIDHVHGDLQRERAAHRKTAAALQDANAIIRQLQRHLAEVDAALAAG